MLYLEDMTVGRRFESGSVTLTTAMIKDFAAQYDPQPFHLDEAAAQRHFFGGLCASGWQTAALTMRLSVETLGRQLAWGIVGGGGDLQWTRPVRPDDTLRVVFEVLENTPSKSRPDRGSVLMRNATLNQNDEEVQVFTVRLLVPRRPA